MLTHLINGWYDEDDSNVFSVSSPFFDLELELQRFTQEHASALETSLNKVRDIPGRSERRKLVEALTRYNPPAEMIHGMCEMTGMPATLIREKIAQGAEMSGNTVDHVVDSSGNNVSVAIAPNDPREYFYFIAHFLAAGTPAIMKMSGREPFLGFSIIEHLLDNGMPGDFLQAVYADTSSVEESNRLVKLMEKCDISIMMGSSSIIHNQVTFNADHSRGLVLDADAAIDHLDHSIQWPQSCLAEHNYVVVGEKNYEKLVCALTEKYEGLVSGDIRHPLTTHGMNEMGLIEEVKATVNYGVMMDIMRPVYPVVKEFSAYQIDKGVVLEHFSEDPTAGMNPLMYLPIPLYLTGVRKVDTVDEALRDLKNAREAIAELGGAEKSMALGIYGSPNEKVMGVAKELAYDIHVNSSPVIVDGRVHQGIDLQKVLRGDRS